MPHKKRKCWIDGCLEMSISWGMCLDHRSKWDDLVRVKRTRLEAVSDVERYEFYVNKAPSKGIQRAFGVRPDCWIWGGGLNDGGYGAFQSDWCKKEGGSARAHVFQIAIILGQEMDPREETDHLCRVRPCSNPDHLERVSQRENNLRGTGFAARNAAKTRCDNGHKFTEENTFFNTLGHRYCKECNRIANREYMARPEVKQARRESYEPISGVRGSGQYQAERDKCEEGHLLEGDNLLIEKKVRNGVESKIRRCRTCTREGQRANYAARQGGEIAPGVSKSDCVTRNQAAEMMGIAPTYAPTFLKRNPGFPEPVRVGRPSYYLKSDVETWIRENADLLSKVGR